MALAFIMCSIVKLALLLYNYSFIIVITFLINALQNNYPEDKIDAFGGKVCTFGSYRLGVHTKGKTTFKERKHFLTN